jgi:hypothetical protein
MSFGAMVREPPELLPSESGGPIRRTGGFAVRSGEGMRPHGWPTMVRRSPHAVVYDAEPGGATYPGLQYMKFLPDGRLVPADALGLAGALGYNDALGADIDPQRAFEEAVARAQAALDLAKTWGLLGAAGLGVLVVASIVGGFKTGVLATAAYGGGVMLTRHIVKSATASGAARSGAGRF